MNQLLPEFLPDYRELLQNVESITTPRGVAEDSFQEFRTALLGSLPSNEADLNITHAKGLADSVVALAVHVYDALVHEARYVERLLAVLAMGTRTTLRWRTQFGAFIPDSHTSHEDSMRAPNPDCVLEVARRTCTLRYQVTSATIVSALKIIANCCANDNDNRRVIIHRNGIDTLVQLAIHDAEADSLIGALYNVCIDFDEPSKILQPIDIAGDSVGDSISAETLPLSVEHLALACRSIPNLATFEAILHLYPKTSEQVRPYLAELVEMATQPALNGFEYIRPTTVNEDNHWDWSFTLGDSRHDTIELVHWFVGQSMESAAHICRAMLNLLSQQTAWNALLKRDKDEIWTLLTLPCGDPLVTDEYLSELDDSLPEELSEARRAYLKLLYQITGQSNFCEPGSRAKCLTRKCISELKTAVRPYMQPDTVSPAASGSKSTNPTARTAHLASACVIISQLAVSTEITNDLLGSNDLTQAIVQIIDYEMSPDVLYPAVTIVSRMALAPSACLFLIQGGVSQKMRRLLTTGGLGLVVPFEAVVAYKTILRAQSTNVELPLHQDLDQSLVVNDMITLWDLTVDAGIKLEVGKYFLQVLRNILSKESANGDSNHIDGPPPSKASSSFSHETGRQVVGIFTWVCTKAEPPAQMDHGWFGLAMLSIWPETRQGICEAIAQNQDLRDAILRISQQQDNAAVGNLKLMLSKLQGECDNSGNSELVRETLQIAMRNCGLITSSQD